METVTVSKADNDLLVTVGEKLRDNYDTRAVTVRAGGVLVGTVQWSPTEDLIYTFVNDDK